MIGFRLYLVTDRRLVPDLPAAVERALSALPPGAAAIQLREKDLPGRELLALARALAPICKARGAPLLVNDRIDVALAVGAGGVHLAGGSVAVAEARSLLPAGAIVGASCHSAAEIEARAGADFLVVGPVFEVPGKGAPLGTALLTGEPPRFALGGVDVLRAREVRLGGAHGVAAIRAWLAVSDPAAAARELLAAAT